MRKNCSLFFFTLLLCSASMSGNSTRATTPPPPVQNLRVIGVSEPMRVDGSWYIPITVASLGDCKEFSLSFMCSASEVEITNIYPTVGQEFTGRILYSPGGAMIEGTVKTPDAVICTIVVKSKKPGNAKILVGLEKKRMPSVFTTIRQFPTVQEINLSFP